jgi:hypothetical protein
MSLIERAIQVTLPHRVAFTRDVFKTANPLLDEILRQGGGTRPPKALVVLDEFRGHLGGELTVTLPGAIGQGFEVHAMHRAQALTAIHALQAPHRIKAGKGPPP